VESFIEKIFSNLKFFTEVLSLSRMRPILNAFSENFGLMGRSSIVPRSLKILWPSVRLESLNLMFDGVKFSLKDIVVDIKTIINLMNILTSLVKMGSNSFCFLSFEKIINI